MPSQIFAHRGASGYAPENTLEAFEMAAQMGAQGVELDVHICRSGELVVAHDETIERVSDAEGWLKDYSLTELTKFHFNRTHPEYQNARIPTLQDVFRLLRPTGLRINVEMKNSMIDYPDLERKVIDLAEKEDMIDRLIFSSFNHHSLLRVKAIDKRFYCGLLYDATLVTPWAYAVALGMDALHPNYTEVLLQPDECSAAHQAGIQVNPWTVNGEEDIRGCLERGADILIGNYPDRSLRLLKEWQATK